MRQFDNVCPREQNKLMKINPRAVCVHKTSLRGDSLSW